MTAAAATAAYEYEYFKVTFPAEYVALVVIDRPEKLNAFLEVMWLNLRQIFRQLSHDPDVRCVVLTGAGDRAFTAGLDVQAAAADGAITGAGRGDVARAAAKIRRHILEFQDCITAIEKCEKPVITVLHGISYGLALDISLASDIRLCTSGTRFSIKEVDIGLAADIGTLSRLPHSGLPLSWVKDICLTAREFNGQEAIAVGLVSGCFESKEVAVEKAVGMARVIGRKSPVAVQGTKEVINYSRGRTVEEGLNYVAVWNAAMLQTKDVKDAMLAGLQKRKPTFEKL
ncbi:hypothetical protein LTR66_009854 [Elasticomyces elasticus]|nr:hypothetical protein LTR66_009854 [Elasticomyces elasticus]